MGGGGAKRTYRANFLAKTASLYGKIQYKIYNGGLGRIGPPGLARGLWQTTIAESTRTYMSRPADRNFGLL